MAATIAPSDPPTLLEQLTALLKSDAMGPSRHEQLTSVHEFISAELATTAETHTAETPTSTALVVVPPAQQQQAIDVDLILSFVMALTKAGGKTPTAKTLAAGLEKSDMPMNERNLKTLASPFPLCILTAQSPAAAADQMIGNSVALQECEQRYKNFRPWLVLAAQQAMHKSNLGATFRLFFGAALSMFDFVTDVLMIRDYFQQRDQVQRAWTLLGMLLANLAFNLVISYLQNRKRGWKAVGKDWLLVLSYLKPGVDAWKVASGAAQEENSLVKPQMEMMMCKSAELVAESIPGTILQMGAFLSTSKARTGFQVRGALLHHDQHSCHTANPVKHLHTPGLQHLHLRVDDYLHINDHGVRL